jgi:phage shock protein A
MGIMSRMSTIVKSRVNAMLDKTEDPRQTLDYSYEKQLQLLQNVKRGVVEVVTSRRRLELQAAQLQDNANKLDDQARRAVAAGRDDLARLALERKQAALYQLKGLSDQIADLEKEQDKLTVTEQRLATKVEAFRTKKEVIKAQYSAAEAQVKIGESATGLSEEMADVGMAIDRAEDKTKKLRARADAIDELVQAGTLEDYTGESDMLDRQLGNIQIQQNVDTELSAMKKQLGTTQPKQLSSGSGGSTEGKQ